MRHYNPCAFLGPMLLQTKAGTSHCSQTQINSHAKDGKQGKHLFFLYSHAYMWQALPSQHKIVQVGQRYKALQ